MADRIGTSIDTRRENDLFLSVPLFYTNQPYIQTNRIWETQRNDMSKRKQFDEAFADADGKIALRAAAGQAEYRARMATACARWRSHDERQLIATENVVDSSRKPDQCCHPKAGFMICGMCAYLQHRCNVRFLTCCCCGHPRAPLHDPRCTERIKGTCLACCLSGKCSDKSCPKLLARCTNCALGPLHSILNGDEVAGIHRASDDDLFTVEVCAMLRTIRHAIREKRVAEENAIEKKATEKKATEKKVGN